ncbi:methyl-accepting chemotaxis protein [Stagnimonas aquatica]|uniref:Methyl-accepting chemotaxis protein n=1 Tax=Stagnimonas aquatica TaxID=2689987 RepID=A0A3N0V8K2_9GAMM|nr:methyl-accepting chemotaxis protein [Stagnimonas aquatica]ROH89049.1 methyl-accepting chemotaxis protein [Stagnimonas aquatica]
MNPIVRRYGLLIIAGLLSILSVVVLHQAQRQGAAPAELDAARLASSRLLNLAIAGDPAAHGGSPDFAALAAALPAAEAALQQLRALGHLGGLATESWTALQTSAKAIVEAQASQQKAGEAAQRIGEAVPALFGSYQQIADRLAQRNAPSGQIYIAAGQLVRLERIANAAARASHTESAQAAVELLDQETKAFAQANQALAEPETGSGMLRDGTAESLAKKVSGDLAPVQESVTALVEVAPALTALAGQLAAFKEQSQRALAVARETEQQLSGALPAAGQSNTLPLIGLVLGALSLGLIAAYILVTVRETRASEERVREQDAIRQGAILNLLDEITNLANGDLTGELTVTEDFTGNIADSLNYTVQTLRGLVGTINRTSVEIAAAASGTADSATRMSVSSEGQAREVVQATRAINNASRSLEDVAGRAEKLAEQAKASVEVAHNGAATVGRTIQGMSTLREQIQDTAKRIKRLGESSQEIGNIIEFINDIAEQTNTLALNASIQAAMAGEAGRGFAVVADEVQRLAERAGSATRQIESLVKTIQADTQEAVTSMERSTANVVGGAKSAEEAGLALTRIEATSQDLAKLIQEIAGAARGQSAETTRLADTMQGIRQVAVETSSTAQQTAEAVSELNLLSEKLRESVAGFKLPTDLSY